MSEAESNTTQELKKIDIMALVRDYWHSFKRMWYIVLALTVLGGAVMYLRSSRSYTPVYIAEATVAVRVLNGGSYASRNTAEQMAKIFPYILTSGALSDIIASDLHMKSVPGSIWTSNISGTNLLTIKASANDAEVAYNILRSALKNYPEVAQYVIGQTEITMIDDGGFPSDTGKTTVIHGSVRNGALVGLALGLAIVLIRAAVTRTIRNEDELRSAVNVNCLGTLPACFSKKHRNEETKREINILYDTNRSAYVESMRLIRTRIERALGENKVLMVTSSVAGEGKSTVAANIAISMALKGKRVILVDCDLRNPSVGRLFNLEGSYPGLRSVLDGTSSLDDALVEISDPKITAGLSLLPGADKETRSIEVLSTDRMGKLLTEMRELADVIVLDTPPSAVLVDAMMLVKHVDTIAYVVMCDYARRRNIVDGIEELNAGGAKIAGCILNGSGSHTGRYGYYGSYGKYGYYGHYGRYGYGYGYGRYGGYGHYGNYGGYGGYGGYGSSDSSSSDKKRSRSRKKHSDSK